MKFRWFVLFTAVAVSAAPFGGGANAATPAKKKLGSPVTIAMFTGDAANFKFPEDEKAMDLAISEINKSGGWLGHKVRKSVCAAGDNANQATACARQFVADPTVVAAWEYTGYFSAVEPILNGAGIPIIASATNTPAEFSCNLCYPVQPGFVGTGGSTALIAAQQLKAKSAYYVVLDVPNGIGFPPFAQSFVAANNLTLENKGVIPIPFTATDLTAQAVKAGSGADAIIITTIETQVTAFLQTAKQQGVKAPIITLMSALPLRNIQQLGAAAEGVYLTTAYNYDAPGAKKVRKYLAKQNCGSGPCYESNEAIAAYMMPFVVRAALEGQKTVDKASITAGMKTLKFTDSQGLYPEIDYTKFYTGYNNQLPRMFNRTLYWYKVVKGKYKLIPPKLRLLLPNAS